MVMDSLYSTDPVSILSTTFGFSKEIAIAIIFVVGVWSLVWKGLALWKSAKKNHQIWFIALLIINSIGILEILYIYLFSEMKFGKKQVSSKKSKRK